MSDVNLVARTLTGNVEYILQAKYSLTGERNQQFDPEIQSVSATPIFISLTLFLYLSSYHFTKSPSFSSFRLSHFVSLTPSLPLSLSLSLSLTLLYDSKVIARYPSTSEKCFLSFDYSYSKRPQFFVYIFIAIYLIFLPICLSIYIYTKPSIHENISLSIYLFDVVLSAFCNTLCISV